MTTQVPCLIEGGDCPFCCARGTGNLKTDKRGGPYFICIGCGTRAFIHSKYALETFSFVLRTGRSYFSEMMKAAPVPAEVKSA